MDETHDENDDDDDDDDCGDDDDIHDHDHDTWLNMFHLKIDETDDDSGDKWKSQHRIENIS